MARPGRLRRPGRGLKTSVKSVESKSTNRLEHKNSDNPQGFDTVAYFAKSEAVRGSSNFVHDWDGMSWFFSSAGNRDAFAADPSKYAPQFGGFCSLSVANGKNARGGGDSWTVHNGKLYLNYDKDVMSRFRSDISGNISKAEGWWPTIKTPMPTGARSSRITACKIRRGFRPWARR